MKVFLGGSISIKRFGAETSMLVEDLMAEQTEFLIGDADGADRELQEYLECSYYGLVTVYACNGKARNNVGGWEVKAINVPAGLYGREYYEQKDIAMTAACDVGLMVWDGKSKGTLNNIKRLVNAGKLCYVCIPKLRYKFSVRWDSGIQRLIEIVNKEILDD